MNVPVYRFVSASCRPDSLCGRRLRFFLASSAVVRVGVFALAAVAEDAVGDEDE